MDTLRGVSRFVGGVAAGFPATKAAFAARRGRYGADPMFYRIVFHRYGPPRRGAQANWARLMNSQAEKKSFSHAL